MKSIISLLLHSIILSHATLHLSPSQMVGRTKITSFYSYDHNTAKDECNNNDKIGIYFDRIGITQYLLEDFPDNQATNALHSIRDCDTEEITLYCCGEERVFEYPSINNNKFKHLFFNFNPIGHHHPDMNHHHSDIYSTAHFDFHWYFISAKERESIIAAPPICDQDRCATDKHHELEEVTCTDLAYCNSDTIEADKYFPGGSDSDWFCTSCVPAMGVHCGDSKVNDGSMADGEFKHTFFMNRWNGVINSNEAMISLHAFQELYESNMEREKCVSYQTPLEYVFGDGCYPTGYCYGCDDDKCWVYLTDYRFKPLSLKQEDVMINLSQQVWINIYLMTVVMVIFIVIMSSFCCKNMSQQ